MNQQKPTFFESINQIPAFVLFRNAAGPIQTLSEALYGISKSNLNEYTYPE